MKLLQGIFGVFTGLLLIVNTLLFGLPVIFLGIFKVALKNDAWRRWWTRPIVALCSAWAYVCMFVQKMIIPVSFDVTYEGEPLSCEQSYMVICNHQSMADIPVLMKAVHGRLPFMRFFAKASLKKVPVFGFAWQLVDCPFMQRYSKEFIEQNPHFKGKDLEQTKLSCRRLRHHPVSIVNYLEGTRFTQRKHIQQGGQYRHLLIPRAGGVALAISALEGQLKYLVDVTIYYHDDHFELWDYLCGRVRQVTIHVNTTQMPSGFALGDYENDPEFRQLFQNWLNQLWHEKDERLDQLARQNTVPHQA